MQTRLGARFAVPLLCLLATVARAHDPGLSAAEVAVTGDRLIAQLTFARADASGLDASRLLEIRANDQLLAPIATGRHADANDGWFEFTYATPPGSNFALRVPAFDQLPRGHRQYLTVRDTDNRLLFEQVLDSSTGEVTIPVSDRYHRSPFRRFVLLGVGHILTGYDHLLFLFGLLLVGGSFRSVAKIITSFTLAHSFTLAAATLNLVQFSSRIVEPLIAVSIIYVGIENILRRGELNWRWLLAFGFGLIHGFGFASALRELGIGSGMGAAVPLFSFNFGVELGQIAIAALVLPVIWKLRERPAFVAHYVPACSLVVLLAGSYWLIERTLLSR